MVTIHVLEFIRICFSVHRVTMKSQRVRNFKKLQLIKENKKNSFYKYLHYALFLCNWERIPGSFCNNSSFDSWKSLSTHSAVNASRIVPISLLSVTREKNHYSWVGKLQPLQQTNFLLLTPAPFTSWPLIGIVGSVHDWNCLISCSSSLNFSSSIIYSRISSLGSFVQISKYW